MTEDGLVKLLAANDTVRVLAAVTTGLVEEGRRRHGTLATATAALGRTLTGCLLVGATMKDEERLSIELVGDGPLRRVMVTTTGDGRVRGYVGRPETHLPPKHGKLDVAGAIGDGLLCVIRTQPWNKEPYRSIMKLVSGEIAEDLAHYLTSSEQMPSAVGLGVFVDREGRVEAAGGWLVQPLSGAAPEVVAAVERTVATLAPVTSLVREGMSAEDVGRALLRGLVPRVAARHAVAFGCPCTRERVFGALTLLGPAELRDMIACEGRAEVRCEFCGAAYHVTGAELEMLVAEPRGTA